MSHLSLAGLPLLIPDSDGRLAAFLDRHQSLESLNLFGSEPAAVRSPRTATRDSTSHGVGLPLPNYPPAPPLRLNSFWWPSGASRWARGLFLCDGATKNELVAEAGGGGGGATSRRLQLAMGNAEGDDGAGVGAGESGQSQQWHTMVWLLPPRPISGGATTSVPASLFGETLWLLPVVDDRYWWQFIHTGDMGITSLDSWADLYSRIGQSVGATIAVDPIPPVYLAPDPVELSRRWDNAGLLLDAIAHSIGQRIVRTLEGDVLAQNATKAEESLNQNLTGGAGGSRNAQWTSAAGDAIVDRGHLPAGVNVTFPRYQQGVPVCHGAKVAYSYASPFSPVTQNTGKTIHSSCLADFSAGGSSPANQSALQALAQRFRDDYFAWLAQQYDYTFHGVMRWTPCGFDDAVEWSFGSPVPYAGVAGGGLHNGSDPQASSEREARSSDGRRPWDTRVAQTRVRSLPADFGVDQQLSQDPSLVRLPHFVIGVLDANLVPGDAPRTPAAVSVWDIQPGSEQDTGVNIQVYPWANETISAGTRVLCFWDCLSSCWYATAYATGAATDVTRFMLTETLELGGSAAAVRRVWNSGTEEYENGGTITVQDFSDPGRWSGENGAEGIAVKLADKTEWDVLWVEHVSIFATATLTANMSGGSATATITDAWQGAGALAVTEIFDTQNLYPGALIGDKFVVCFDDRTGERKYRIIDGPAEGSQTRLKWAVAQSKWVNNAGNGSYVDCLKCGDDAGNDVEDPEEDGEIRVYLPRPGNSQDPNVDSPDVIGYMLDDNGKAFCVTDYLDDAIGMFKQWVGQIANIPRGWALMDGVENASGSGWDLGRRYIGGYYAGDTDPVANFGILGDDIGARQHTHADHAANETGTVDLEVTTNMTGSPYAEGTTDGASLSVNATGTISLSGFTEYATTDIEITPHPQHKHGTIWTSSASTGQGVTLVGGGTSVILTIDNCTTNMREDVTDCLAANETYPHNPFDPEDASNDAKIIEPGPHSEDPDIYGHRHALSGVVNVSGLSASVSPNPHTHDVTADVFGITFSPDTVDPNPHKHTTPVLAHAAADHYPQTIVVAFIERIY